MLSPYYDGYNYDDCDAVIVSICCFYLHIMMAMIIMIITMMLFLVSALLSSYYDGYDNYDDYDVGNHLMMEYLTIKLTYNIK